MATRGTGVATVLTATSVALATAGAKRLVTVHQVASGGSATTSNQVHVQTVYAGQSTSLDIAGMMAAAGAALYFKADVGSVVNLSLNVFRSDQTP
jgi:hypothetical protein